MPNVHIEGTRRQLLPSNLGMNANSSNLDINTERTRTLLSELYSELELVPAITTVDGEDIPGFGAFLEALNAASLALGHRAQALTQDGAELAESLTATLHSIEAIDADAATRFSKL